MAEPASSGALILEANLGPKAMIGLKDDLCARRGRPVTLDASNVSHIGGGCLQLLLSAKLTWASDNQNFNIVSPSQSVLQALETTGLDKAFADEEGALP